MKKLDELEAIKPFFIIDEVKKRIAELDKLRKKLEKAINNEITESIRCAKNHNSFQYYKITTSHDREGKYISRKDEHIAKRIVQQEYFRKFLKAAESQQKVLEQFSKNWDETALKQVYERLPEGKKRLVEPAILTDDMFEKKWQDVSFNKKLFSPDVPEYFTSRGERVRSKSEIIIADTLTRLNIPYRYEFPVTLKVNGNKIPFYPDFYCLNVRTRKEYVWEHFGMMDDADYAGKSCEKIKIYGENNIFPGENLIITMETQQKPINSKDVERLARKWLL